MLADSIYTRTTSNLRDLKVQILLSTAAGSSNFRNLNTLIISLQQLYAENVHVLRTFIQYGVTNS